MWPAAEGTAPPHVWHLRQETRWGEQRPRGIAPAPLRRSSIQLQGSRLIRRTSLSRGRVRVRLQSQGDALEEAGGASPDRWVGAQREAGEGPSDVFSQAGVCGAEVGRAGGLPWLWKEAPGISSPALSLSPLRTSGPQPQQLHPALLGASSQQTWRSRQTPQEKPGDSLETPTEGTRRVSWAEHGRQPRVLRTSGWMLQRQRRVEPCASVRHGRAQSAHTDGQAHTERRAHAHVGPGREQRAWVPEHRQDSQRRGPTFSFSYFRQ